MIPTKLKTIAVHVAAIACLGVIACAQAQPSAAQKGESVASHAKGTFDVKMTPQEDAALDKTFSRMSIDKQIHGDLEATSKGLMLATGGPKEGAGGYVALERVTGKLGGLTGSFTLQHNATMQNGKGDLNIIVVPGSGTEQLAGLSGKFNIEIKDGKHYYDMEYTLPAQ
jgi:uncharacterized protein DUF3224